MEKIIEVKNLCKSFGTFKAVDGLDFSVDEGHCHSFLGPNGAGKTTTMKMLYAKALRDPREDTKVSVLGFDPEKDQLAVKSLTGVVPQADNLDTELNVLQNLKIYCGFQGLRGKQATGRIDELLEFFELTEKKKALISQLSGGMKRRLIIARALLNEPKLLILDEPTTGLDPQVRQHIWEKLRALKKQKVTILLTTHYMEEAFQLSDHIVIMDKGKKVLEGAPKKMLETSVEKYVLEVYSKDIIKAEQASFARCEETADRCIFYSDDFQALEKLCGPLEPGQHFLRPSNLEDVFLKTTGRKLNDEQ